jgi:ABC-type nickel/cobalt efflux system permease component RcnA
MRRAAVLAVIALATFAAPASAHPLGNFTINHLTTVSISRDRVDVAYTVDQAEIPTFQERGQPVLANKRAEAARGLALYVDGRRVPLVLGPGGRLSFPMGQGGLRTTRVELALSGRAAHARRVEIRDRTFPGRLGWKAIVVRPGEGTAVRSSVPATDPTGGLRHYPRDLLKEPPDQRRAGFEVAPGRGTVSAPRGAGGGTAGENRSGDGFAGVFADAASGRGVLLLLLVAAFAWGALHALSPGHGKGMVAAYLVGTRGSARHAVALGATVTIAHTAGVFLLGVVTLALSQYVLPEDLYPWLTLASGLLVVAVGVGVLRARIRQQHHHHHHAPGTLSWKGLVAMGASAGLIPCPSALVVLLAALSQHQVALGLVLITAFSLGLAATISVIGLVVVYAQHALARVRFSTRLPAVSAAVIVAVGCVLTAKAVPGVLG